MEMEIKFSPGANLKGANLQWANLKVANLKVANLTGANLTGANLQWANLKVANLTGADLTGANLTGANLKGADFQGANLQEADFQGAYLKGADFQGANLWGSILVEADLTESNLTGANLQEAYLQGADLTGAKNIPEVVLAQTTILPEGDIIGWKKSRTGIVKLLIPKEARRSNATGRKCRAEFADVLEVFGDGEHLSKYDSNIRYVVGTRVYADKFDDDRWRECAGGIHFFITRKEAEDHI